MAATDYICLMMMCFFMMTMIGTFDNGSDCAPLDEDRNGTHPYDGGNEVHIDIW